MRLPIRTLRYTLSISVFRYLGIALMWVPLATAPIAAVVAQQADTQALSKERLEQLVASIALYPDALLAQVLMASTYHLDVVQAQRWVQSNPKLDRQALKDT